MPRILAVGLIILVSALLVVLVVGAAGNRKSDGEGPNAETPTSTGKKFEERAPAGELRKTSSKALLARHTRKTEMGDWKVFSKARQGGIWNHDGSIVRAEAIGRTRRFFYVEVRGGSPAKSGDVAFEGVREGPTYSGRAFQFAENCAPLGYLVKGSISADESTVKMEGIKPLRDSQCRIAGYVNQELVFNLKL
jgi:hypothetical protein